MNVKTGFSFSGFTKRIYLSVFFRLSSSHCILNWLPFAHSSRLPHTSHWDSLIHLFFAIYSPAHLPHTHTHRTRARTQTGRRRRHHELGELPLTIGDDTPKGPLALIISLKSCLQTTSWKSIARNGQKVNFRWCSQLKVRLY